jgi:hypothetical protein
MFYRDLAGPTKSSDSAAVHYCNGGLPHQSVLLYTIAMVVSFIRALVLQVDDETHKIRTYQCLNIRECHS